MSRIVAIDTPTREEIAIMLDCVALTHDLSQILPTYKGLSNAEFLKRGWCFLFYDKDSLAPLGYFAVSFSKLTSKPPEIFFATTQFCRPLQLLTGIKFAMRIINSLGTVCAQIVNRKVIKLANTLGFKRQKKGNWYGFKIGR